MLKTKKHNYRDLLLNDKSELKNILYDMFVNSKNKEIYNIFQTERLYISELDKNFIGFMKANYLDKDTTERQDKIIVAKLNKYFDFGGYDVDAMIYQSTYKLG